MFKRKHRSKELDIDISILSKIISVPDFAKNPDLVSNSQAIHRPEIHNRYEPANRQDVKFVPLEELIIRFPQHKFPKDTEGGWITESGDRIFLVIGGIHHFTTPLLID